MMKESVKNTMQQIEYIATTTDCWTAHRQSFLGVTAHWLDPESLQRQSAALACRRLKGSHTHDLLASSLDEIHTEYSIRGKIVRTTTDNASNFVKAFRVFASENENAVDSEEDDEDPEEDTEAVDVEALLEEEDDSFQYQLPKHHRCTCHLINLIATVDAKKAETNIGYRNICRSAFAKCFGLWNKSARSATAAEIIEKECKLQLIHPVETRWNSYFLAVERVLRIVRESGEGAIRAVTIALKVPMFSPAELEFLAEYAAVMSPVSNALNILQGEAIHMGWLVPTITILTEKLNRLQASSKFCQPLVVTLQDGIQRRFSDMLADPELIAASILLPKFRSSWTRNEDLLKLGMDYIKTHMESYTATSTPNLSGSDEVDDFCFSMGNASETTHQLDVYMASSVTSMDILKSVPALLKLSLKLNTPLPASAACERLFSTAGHIFSAKRGRLSSKNFENQLLLKLNKTHW
ncbi:uncharacterized protein LOC132900019 [Neoarius graeffei]|uniref:uncharacterized protein LOC132900019 n=1 Tax=Neoarius graeffei TaxID=443677 RepID=UPI00298CF64B|nr:uncharacterized protein LOC132900019 [Neoarius graeffei]